MGPESPVVRAAAALAASAVRRGWRQLLAVSLLSVAFGALCELAAALVAQAVLPAETRWLLAHMPARAYTVVSLEAAAIHTVFDGIAYVFGFGAAAAVTAAIAAEAGHGTRAALRSALARLAPLTAAYLLFGLTAIALAALGGLLLVLAPVGVPVAIAGAVIWFRRPARRRLAGWMLTLGLPFGLLARACVAFALSLPAVAVDGEGPVASMRVSARLVRGRWWQSLALLAGAALAAVAVALAAAGLGGLLAALLAPGAKSAPAWATALNLAAGILTSQLPAVAITALYLVLRDRGPAAPPPSAPQGAPRGRGVRWAGRRAVAGTAMVFALGAVAPPQAVFAATPAPASSPVAPGPSPSAAPAPSPKASPAAKASPAPAAAPAPLAAPAPSPSATARPRLPAIGGYVVTTLADSGPGSLRAVVAQAAIDNPSANTAVTFSVSGTITLLSRLDITSPVTLDGSGQSVTISGGDAVPVLTTSFSPVGISNLSITHGNGTGTNYAGGLTTSGGTVTVTAVTFDSNTGDVAGGLIARGYVLLNNSTFTGNWSNSSGGAMTVGERVDAVNDTFVLNSGAAPPNGGAIKVLGYLHGIGLTVVRSSGSGIDYINGSVFLADSALDSNGNGDCFGFTSVALGPGNADSDGSCTQDPTLYHFGPSQYDQNPGWHGGPTQTIALFPGANAIGRGDPATCPATDQRGVARAAACSAGAYEFQPQLTLTLATAQSTYNHGDTVALTATATGTYESDQVYGDITFYDGGTALGTATLSSGVAVFGVSTLSVGPHTLSATYPGQVRGFAAATSNSVPVTVAGALSTLATVSSLNPSTAGDPVTFTANLRSGTAGSATGTIDFVDGTTVLSTVSVASDTATFTTSALAPGHHVITTSYSGDATHSPATSPNLDQDVRSPSVTAAAAASPAVFGTASVSVTVTGGSTTPTGYVSCVFNSGYASAALDASGRATCNGAGYLPGTGTVAVSYGGDDAHAPSSGTVALVVTAAPTAQALTADHPAPVYGQPVVLTATVTATGTPAIPSGSVQFFSGGTPIATAALDPAGSARTTVAAPALGLDSFTSTYTPDPGFAAAAGGSTSITVAAAPTTTALVAGTASAVTGQPVVLTATVTPGGGSTATAAGSVLFSDGGGLARTVALSGGSAVLTVSTLSVGAHAITATFVPAAGFLASASAPASVTVAAAATTTTLAEDQASGVNYGVPVTLTATVAPVAPGGGAPGGSVDFTDGTTDLGTRTLDSSGRASLTLTLPQSGMHSFGAAYSGTTAYLASSTGPVPFSVSGLATQTWLTVSGTPIYGNALTLSARVASTTGTPVTGSVQFVSLPHGTVLGTAPIDGSGNAVLITAATSGDSTAIYALFPGNTNFAGSINQQNVAMQRAAPVITVLAAPDPSTMGGTVTFTFAVSGVAGGSVPLGMVTPALDGSSLPADFVDSTGTMTRTIAAPSIGTHSISGAYGGDTNYAPAFGFTHFNVQGADPGLSVASLPDPAGTGVPFTLTATLAGSGGRTPQGTVDFFETGGGLRLLGTGTVANDGTAHITFTWPVPATLAIRAVYNPTDGYFRSASVDRPLVVSRIATSMIGGVNSLPPWVSGSPITVGAFVSSPVPVTGGTVTFYDGTPATGTWLGVSALSSGGATLAVSSFRGGSHTVTAVYSGDPGFLGSSTTFTFLVAAHPSAITLTPASLTPNVGAADAVFAAVTATDGYRGSPTGLVTISDGTQSCTVPASGSTCALRWSSAGVRFLQASYAGDAEYAPATASAIVTVNRATPVLNAFVPEVATGYPQRWIAGNTLNVAWSMPASDATGTVTVSILGSGVCSAQPRTGSCTVTLPAAGALAVTVAYSGDALYLPVTQTLNGTALACHYFGLDASPVGAGTVNLLPAPDCRNGRGYADGDTVFVSVTPAAHYRFLGWDGHAFGDQGSFVTTVTTDTAVIARFDVSCQTVTVINTADSRWYADAGPRALCGTPSGDIHNVNYPVYYGALITLVNQDWSDAARGQFIAGGWTDWGSTYGATGPSVISSDRYALTVTGDTTVRPEVSRPCYAFTVTGADTGATVAVQGSTCTTSSGAAGYHYGDRGGAQITPAQHDSGSYDIAPGTFVVLGATLSGTDAGSITPTYDGIYRTVVHGPDTLAVSLAECRRLTLGTLPDYIGARFSVSGHGCTTSIGYPVNWWAGPVTVTEIPPSGTLQFYTWQGAEGPGVSPVVDGSTVAPATITLDGSRDRHLVAAYGQPGSCYPVSVEVGSHTFSLPALTSSLSGVIPTSPVASFAVYARNHDGTSGHGYCPGNLYEAGAIVDVEINPTVAGIVGGFQSRAFGLNSDGTLNHFTTNLSDPLDESGTPVAGGAGHSVLQESFILPAAGQGGHLFSLVAWACYPVNVTEYAQLAGGQTFVPANGMVALDAFSDSAVCPIGGDTVLPGSRVGASVAVQPGYTLDRWTGSASGSATHVTAVANGPLGFNAVLHGQCYRLTIVDHYTASSPGGDDVLRSDDPNCPAQDATGGLYIPGTVVALQATDKGSGTPFEGWQGVDRAISGNIAVVTMNSDHNVSPLYNDDLQHPTANAAAFADYASTVAKATTGALATALSDYVLNFTDIGLITLVGAIGDGLGAIGVPYAAEIGNTLNSISATLTGPLDCIGTWGLQGGGAYAPTSTASSAGSYTSSGAGGVDTAVNTVRGEGTLGGLAQKLDGIKSFSASNAGTLSKASSATYALKWVALGVQLGTQISSIETNSDWSASTFENDMKSCLRQRGSDIATNGASI